MIGASEGIQLPARNKQFMENGDFIASFLIWVNQVGLGGATFFSSMAKLDAIQPSKGSAVFWVSGKANGKKDLNQEHGGCPVYEGSKFVVGKWIYHFDHWKSIPCGVDTNADVKMDIIPRS